MKAYTDLEQSKKLAEILPLESADMRYHTISHFNPYPCKEMVYTVDFAKASDIDIPCWSLAALISVLPNEIKHDGIVNNLWITSDDVSYYSTEYDSYLYEEEGCTVDAAYEMIMNLHELNLL